MRDHSNSACDAGNPLPQTLLRLGIKDNPTGGLFHEEREAAQSEFERRT